MRSIEMLCGFCGAESAIEPHNDGKGRISWEMRCLSCGCGEETQLVVRLPDDEPRPNPFGGLGTGGVISSMTVYSS